MYRLRVHSTLPPDLENLVTDTIGCCLTVHRALGPGLLEKVYPRAVACELKLRGIPFELEHSVAVRYKGRTVCYQRIDIFVDERVVVEIKSIDRFHPIHTAQVISYLRLTGARVGLLVTFNVPVLKQGIRRIVL